MSSAIESAEQVNETVVCAKIIVEVEPAILIINPGICHTEALLTYKDNDIVGGNYARHSMGVHILGTVVSCVDGKEILKVLRRTEGVFDT